MYAATNEFAKYRKAGKERGYPAVSMIKSGGRVAEQ
jgi:hypothetical protein